MLDTHVMQILQDIEVMKLVVANSATAARSTLHAVIPVPSFRPFVALRDADCNIGNLKTEGNFGR